MSDDKDHDELHREISNELVRTTLRFENGQKEFTSMRTDITKLQTTIEPKPVNWPYVIFSSLGVLVVLLTAWFALGSKFAERPTRSEVDTQIQALVNNQTELTKAQGDQRRLLDKIEAEQQSQQTTLMEMHQDLRTLVQSRR